MGCHCILNLMLASVSQTSVSTEGKLPEIAYGLLHLIIATLACPLISCHLKSRPNVFQHTAALAVHDRMHKCHL
jgi:hypothetical protein